MKYELPQLSYSYNALEPYIDSQTMELHHGKHHAGYVSKLNAALEGHEDLADKSLEDLLTSLDSLPEDIRVAVRNNGGGHYNHSLFWKVMSPKANGGGGDPEGVVLESVIQTFGSIASFRDEFAASAVSVFGSGWVWLVMDDSQKLSIKTTPNQDSPVSRGLRPILGLDVWEHAYYLKYQNRRPDYIEAWWNVVNWQGVESNFRAIVS